MTPTKPLLAILSVAALAGCDSTEPSSPPSAWAGEMVYTDSAQPHQAASTATDTIKVHVWFEKSTGGINTGGAAVAVVRFFETGPNDDECGIWFLPEDDDSCLAWLDAEGTYIWNLRHELLVVGFDVPVQPADSTAARDWPEHCKWAGQVLSDTWYASLRCGDDGEEKAVSLFVPYEG
ncbi:MAG: hypothetical protein F4X60_14225 [Gemmatimonadetes bacterium]|nr:hypothetical protein [Gemmatimonadota bacterium]MYB99694.1 hypothetical protein [Gemmatimonadota bacterium]